MNRDANPPPLTGLGVAGRVAQLFIHSKLTLLVLAASFLLGLMAVLMLPREEEPQIKVPMMDVEVLMPGARAGEVEDRITRPLEKLLWEIPGVEYVYSTSSEGRSLIIVRFKVGEDADRCLVLLNKKLGENRGAIPPGATDPLVKSRSIDDVPILCLTFHSSHYDHLTLRRLAAQVNDAVKQVPLVAETTLIGGESRKIRVLPDPVRLAAHNLALEDLAPALQQADRQYSAGNLTMNNQDLVLDTGGFLESASDVENVVVGVYQGKPVYVRDVARVVDGSGEPDQYVFFETRATRGIGASEPAVTLTVAKRPGANAIYVAGQVLKKVDALKGWMIPGDVQVTVTRNYGLTAQEKSNELLWHMLIAVVSVSALIGFALGWRESLIVALAIPATLSLTLLVFYLHGYTLNRITLFALIFSIGILVDDAIVVVENIVRHFHKPENAGRDRARIAVEAVAEVGNPTILATLAVMAAVLPMAWVGGLMGPYMRPIPIGSSAAMFFSLAISFIVTPWAAIRILEWRSKPGQSAQSHTSGAQQESEVSMPGRFYEAFMRFLLKHDAFRIALLGTVVLLLLGSMAMVYLGWVKVKMLPFDNKSEFQVILNMPAGSSLEKTAQCARAMAGVIREEPEVDNEEVYVGIASPFNFNGLVRHYFMRSGADVADIQVNLLPKEMRKAQSHEIAKRVRPELAAIGQSFGAHVAVAEVPPGPPVLQTLVAEIYGPTQSNRLALARQVLDLFQHTPGVVDADWYVEADQPRVDYVMDKEKAALNGISASDISETLRMANHGEAVDLLHAPNELESVPIEVRLPLADRFSTDSLLALRVRGARGGVSSAPLVPLRELVSTVCSTNDKSIYHKNLMPVIYVIGDVAGVVESPAYAIFKMNHALAGLDARQFGGSSSLLKIYNARQPFTERQPALKWDGEWQITLEVFRDLGLAFAVVLVLIYILMVGWFRSFLSPVIVMMVIPFSLIGVLPAHAMFHAFFTATSMIGFMAGAGIVVRNSIILVDFIEMRLAEGHPLAEAVIEAGRVRFRPIMLTALAVVAGGLIVLSDPIFQGLAIALMAGSLVSMVTAPILIPLLYHMAHSRLRKSEIKH